MRKRGADWFSRRISCTYHCIVFSSPSQISHKTYYCLFPQSHLLAHLHCSLHVSAVPLQGTAGPFSLAVTKLEPFQRKLPCLLLWKFTGEKLFQIPYRICGLALSPMLQQAPSRSVSDSWWEGGPGYKCGHCSCVSQYSRSWIKVWAKLNEVI